MSKIETNLCPHCHKETITLWQRTKSTFLQDCIACSYCHKGWRVVLPKIGLLKFFFYELIGVLILIGVFYFGCFYCLIPITIGYIVYKIYKISVSKIEKCELLTINWFIEYPLFLIKLLLGYCGMQLIGEYGILFELVGFVIGFLILDGLIVLIKVTRWDLLTIYKPFPRF